MPARARRPRRRRRSRSAALAPAALSPAGAGHSREPAKGSALDIPAKPSTGSQRLLARLARLPVVRSSQRVQNSRLSPHNGLVERILGTQNIAQVVPRLQPDVLHRIIQRCGLEDCVELLALATPGQLAHVFDLDLWRAGAPGLDER